MRRLLYIIILSCGYSAWAQEADTEARNELFTAIIFSEQASFRGSVDKPCGKSAPDVEDQGVLYRQCNSEGKVFLRCDLKLRHSNQIVTLLVLDDEYYQLIPGSRTPVVKNTMSSEEETNNGVIILADRLKNYDKVKTIDRLTPCQYTSELALLHKRKSKKITMTIPTDIATQKQLISEIDSIKDSQTCPHIIIFMIDPETNFIWKSSAYNQIGELLYDIDLSGISLTTAIDPNIFRLPEGTAVKTTKTQGDIEAAYFAKHDPTVSEKLMAYAKKSWGWILKYGGNISLAVTALVIVGIVGIKIKNRKFRRS